MGPRARAATPTDPASTSSRSTPRGDELGHVGRLHRVHGAEWRVGSAFGLVGDLHAGFGYAVPVDDVSVAPGFRFAAGDHLGITLALGVPLVGRDRAPLAVADLRVAWRL